MQFQIDRFRAFVLRRRWLVVTLTAALTGLLMVGMQGLTVSGSYRVLFGEDNPHLLAFDKLQDTYSASRSALIAIAPMDGTVFSQEVLAAIEDLTEDAWRTPYSVRVDSLTNYSHSEAFEDDLTVAPLVEDAALLSNADLDRIQSIALNEPELVGQLISNDGRVAGLIINFALSEPEEPAWAEITGYLRTLLHDARTENPEISYFLTGNVILNQTFAEAGKDAEKLVPVVFVVILFIAAVVLRSLYAIIPIAVMILFVVFSAMGAAGWAKTMLTPVSASIPVILMAVAVAHAIHIVIATQEGIRRGLEQSAAVLESLRENFYPVFLTSATTAIGFLSLNTSNSPPFHVLGNLTALGMLFTFVYSVTLLPALLSIVPMHAAPVKSGHEGFFERLGKFVVARCRLLLWSSTIVVVVLASGIVQNRTGDRWLHHFDDRYAFRTDTEFIVQNLTGLDRIEYSLDSGIEGGVSNPEYLKLVETFAEWYRSQPEVLHVFAFSELLKRVNRNMHGDDPAYYRIPDDPESAAQFLLLYEFSLPFGADLNDRVNIGKSATRMTVVLKDTSTREHLELDARARAWLQANAPGLASPASGFTMISAHLSDQNVSSMLRSTILATGLISLILLVVFRSIRIGLICLVPNFVPAAMAFGLWGHLSTGYIGLGASVVIAIAIGIIVDDTIHFIARYLSGRRDGLTAPDAVRETLRTVGPALWATTAILVTGFLVFSYSGYEPSYVLGILVAITIAFALIADLLLLPALIMAVDNKD